MGDVACKMDNIWSLGVVSTFGYGKGSKRVMQELLKKVVLMKLEIRNSAPMG